ncbi:DUF3970 family protein [Caproiciproducens sp. LBM24188]
MMIKIRITGLPEEIDSFLNELRELFLISDESKQYKNSRSRFVRKYADIEKPKSNDVE